MSIDIQKWRETGRGPMPEVEADESEETTEEEWTEEDDEAVYGDFVHDQHMNGDFDR